MFRSKIVSAAEIMPSDSTMVVACHRYDRMSKIFAPLQLSIHHDCGVGSERMDTCPEAAKSVSRFVQTHAGLLFLCYRAGQHRVKI